MTYRIAPVARPDGRFPLRVSRRDVAGHDAGRIHLARPRDDRYDTACGLTIGQYGVVEHQIGPTCRMCRAWEA
jgi:hypothetical protein